MPICFSPIWQWIQVGPSTQDIEKATSQANKEKPSPEAAKKKKNAVTQNFTELVKGKQNFNKNKLMKTLFKVNSD